MEQTCMFEPFDLMQWSYLDVLRDCPCYISWLEEALQSESDFCTSIHLPRGY